MKSYTLTKAECIKLFASKTNNSKGESCFVNPKTNRLLKEKGLRYTKYMEYCNNSLKEQRTELLVNNWITHPLINPINKKKTKIYLFEYSDYTKMYHLAYDYFQNKKMSKEEIQNKLPKNHLLFSNQLDVLFLRKNTKNIPKEYYNMYKMINEIFEKYGDFQNVRKYFKYPISLHKNNATNEKILMFILVDSFCQSIADYMSQVVESFEDFSSIYDKFGNSIFFKEQGFNYIKQFLDLYNIYPMFDDLFKVMYKRLVAEKLSKTGKKVIPLKQFYNTLFKDSTNKIESFIIARNEMIQFMESGDPYSVKTVYLQKLFGLLKINTKK